MEKPTIMVVSDVKENIIKIVNDSKLPPFILRPIFQELYNQMVELERDELKMEKEQYMASIKSEKKEKEVL